MGYEEGYEEGSQSGIKSATHVGTLTDASELLYHVESPALKWAPPDAQYMWNVPASFEPSYDSKYAWRTCLSAGVFESGCTKYMSVFTANPSPNAVRPTIIVPPDVME